MLDRTQAPAFQEIGNIHLKNPEVIHFKNGIPVYIFQSPEQELVRIEWMFNNIFPDPENPLINSALSAMLKEGTSQHTSAQIADEVDFYGAFLLPEYGFDGTSLTLYTLNKHSRVLLPLVKEILTDSVVPQRELDTYLRINKQKLQVSLEKNDYLARGKFYNLIFGTDNRYGKTPTLPDYDQVNREQLHDLYTKQFTAQNCKLIISGNVSTELLTELEHYFGEPWGQSEGDLSLEAPQFSTVAGHLEYVEKTNALQSAIRLGCRTIQRSHPDYPALQFVITLLGGFFGSRLMRNIREEKGYTYGIGAAVVNLKYGGFMTIATEVGVDVTNATLKEIEKEIEHLRTTRADDEEIELVKNYLTGAMLGSLESIFSHADKFKNVLLNDLSLDYYQYYMQEIRSMTAEKVREIAIRYVDYAAMTKVVVGKMEDLGNQ